MIVLIILDYFFHGILIMKPKKCCENLINNADLLLLVDVPEDDGPVAAPAGEHALVDGVPGHRGGLLLVPTECLDFLLQIPRQRIQV